MLKHLIIQVVIVLLLFNMIFAAETKEKDTAPIISVTIRYSRHKGFSRLVFETKEESFLKDTQITHTPDRILVEFPSVPKITPQGSLDIETSLKGNYYEINIKNPFRIKVLKLSSPPRISVDIFIQPKDELAIPPASETAPIAKSQGLKVLLDPGHGGYDLGVIRNNIREKDLALSIAHEVEAAASKTRKTISLTRKSDQFMSILDRALLANQKSPEVFVSLHLSTTEAFVIYTSTLTSETPDNLPRKFSGLITHEQGYKEKVKVFSEGLEKALRDEFKTTEVLLRDMPLSLLNSVAAPAVLIEIPAALASDVASRKKISGALIKALTAYANR